MFERRLLVLGLVFLMASGSAFITPATPSVKIASPANGQMLTTRSVNVTGVTSGVYGRWLQTSKADFDAGSMVNLSSNAGGYLTNSLVYDDFNDDSLDNNLWTVNGDQGIAVSETGGELVFSGNGPAAKFVLATTYVSDWVSADLVSFSVGGGAAMDYLQFNDGNNAIEMGYDNYGGPDTYLFATTVISNVQTRTVLGPAPVGAHNLAIRLLNGKADLYFDGSFQISLQISLTDPIARFGSHLASYGASSDVRWDNVMNGFPGAGQFTSSVCDTKAEDTPLTDVDWNATVQSGNEEVDVRSGDTKNMTAATQWTSVSNGQTAGLPVLKRYFQYRVVLPSSNEMGVPRFSDISFIYDDRVVLVELSIDNKTTWLTAEGTEYWSATLTLPENSVTIWVRATGVTGDINITSIKVDVDTTPPIGSVVINDDAPYCTSIYVELTLNATDAYGIAATMISDSLDFEDGVWDSYPSPALWKLTDGDGLKTVYVKYKDTNGWESKVYSDSILLDTTPPIGNIIIDGGAAYTRNSTVILSINATDLSGLDGMMVSNTPDFSGAQWIDYKETISWALVPGSENRTVYVKFRDMGGHVSQAYSDSIIEDLVSPAVKVVINGGAPYTQSRNVSVELRPVENNVVASMQVREGDGSFTENEPWVALATNITWSLSAGEGTKMVSARLMDAAGNIGASASSTILYDSTSPSTKIGAIPATSPKAKVTVSWNATDAKSGVLWYDVQSKAGDGSWMDWLTHVNETSATFTGEDLQTYQFRARAEDRAGNLEDFPATVDNSVIIQLPEPIVTFILPKEGATVSGKATFNGTCQLMTDGRNVTRVEWRFDNDTWQTADGLLIWGFKLDTTKLKDGKHVVQVRTFDGAHYSTEVVRQFKVNNAKPKSFLGADGLVLFALAVGTAVTLMARRRIVER